jgi:hypothetical protein
MTRSTNHAVQHFIAAHSIVHRVHTHQSQESIAAVQNKAKDWIKQMHPKLFGGNQDQFFIINMDQTPIFFCMLLKTTIEASGAQTVTVHIFTNSMVRVTVAVTVTASGHMLLPLFFAINRIILRLCAMELSCLKPFVMH